MTKDEDIRRAEQAARILDDPLIQEVLASMREDFTDQWRNSRPDDVEAREGAYRMLRCVDRFEEKLITLVNSGKIAKANAAR